ncbi:exosortase family protein XrtF [uncultured Lutibacter sp.]|uniref:exosortase family protein XrtF n=1 Tax=uncultured Lutibacter sp. TaxID=437739 RepID=UPI00262C2DC1|nr:exosortase family protein XrtF [uncultured Lutibacter sp.]
MQSNKTVILFLIKFFGTYILLFLIYSAYLNKTQKNSEVFSCAPITKIVAKQTEIALNFFGYNAKIEQHTEEVSVKLFIDNIFIARIIEGCNSISIIILFISFIVAFSSDLETTFLFIVFGSLLLYVTNVFRIVIISIALYKFPQYQYVLHDILFPLIIYGTTFLLWFLWIRKFSTLKK